MKRLPALIAVALFASACFPTSASFVGLAPPGSDAFECATRELNRLGYTIEDADRAAGFVRAVRRTSILGTTYTHTITASVFDGDEGETVRVTVTRDEQGRILRPDGDTQEHANALLDVCGPTRVQEATGWLRQERAAELEG